MAGETYWRCKRCEVCFVMSGPPVGCANDMCASSSFEPVVVLPVAEYERLSWIEARLRDEGLANRVAGASFGAAIYRRGAIDDYRRAVLWEEKP